jgi:hypothetical protein
MFYSLKVKYFILIVFTFCNTFSCYTQILTSELDAYQSTDSLYAVRNTFKIDPLQVINGDIPLLFEKYITKHISVELGLGVTRRNFLSPVFEYDLDNLSRSVKIRTQPSFKIGFRYYFDNNEELDGFYVSPEYNYRVNRKDFLVLDSIGNTTGSEFIDKRTYTDLKLVIGRQVLSYSSNFLVDYYLGFGFRSKKLNEVHQLIGNSEDYFYEVKNENKIAFFIGIKLGFGF